MYSALDGRRHLLSRHSCPTDGVHLNGTGFFIRQARSLSRPQRKAMIERGHALPVTHQCELLALSRSSAYHQPAPVSQRDLEAMRRLDEAHLQYPFYGSRRLSDWLGERGVKANRKRVRRLMRRMGLEALYPRPRTSRPGKGHKVYPYLLRELTVERPNQVWAADICYLPMARGFLYLVAVMDWYSRKVLAWRLSNALHGDFCVEAVEDALAHFGSPEIFNTDQGAQFTSTAFTDVLIVPYKMVLLE